MSTYSNTTMTSRALLLNVGWMVPNEPIDKVGLATHLLRNPLRGIHGCPFCNHEHIFVQLDGKDLLLGMSEVWLPSPNSEIIYIAPSLLLHYIAAHNYEPPAQVVEDVLALPANIGDVGHAQGLLSETRETLR